MLVEGFNVGGLRELYEALYSENERDAQYGKWQSIRLIKEILLKFCNGIGNTIDVEKIDFAVVYSHDIEYILTICFQWINKKAPKPI